ncbi:MAG: hypothetical protein EYC62_09700 [Alphaproteobacteria bacterium]|nr:MAG: hypothetical protein EYC62_09700 [Alphaproteobacteria bacterium]
MSNQQEYKPNPYGPQAFDKSGPTFGQEEPRKPRNWFNTAKVWVLAGLSVTVSILSVAPTVQRLVQIKQLSNQFTQNYKQGKTDQAMLALAKLYAITPAERYYKNFGEVATNYLAKRVNDKAWLNSAEWQNDQELFKQILNIKGIDQSFFGGNNQNLRDFVLMAQKVMFWERMTMIAELQPSAAAQIYVGGIKSGYAVPALPSYDRANQKMADLSFMNKDVLGILRQNKDADPQLKFMAALADTYNLYAEAGLYWQDARTMDAANAYLQAYIGFKTELSTQQSMLTFMRMDSAEYCLTRLCTASPEVRAAVEKESAQHPFLNRILLLADKQKFANQYSKAMYADNDGVAAIGYALAEAKISNDLGMKLSTYKYKLVNAAATSDEALDILRRESAKDASLQGTLREAEAYRVFRTGLSFETKGDHVSAIKKYHEAYLQAEGIEESGPASLREIARGSMIDAAKRSDEAFAYFKSLCTTSAALTAAVPEIQSDRLLIKALEISNVDPDKAMDLCIQRWNGWTGSKDGMDYEIADLAAHSGAAMERLKSAAKDKPELKALIAKAENRAIELLISTDPVAAIGHAVESWKKDKTTVAPYKNFAEMVKAASETPQSLQALQQAAIANPQLSAMAKEAEAKYQLNQRLDQANQLYTEGKYEESAKIYLADRTTDTSVNVYSQLRVLAGCSDRVVDLLRPHADTDPRIQQLIAGVPGDRAYAGWKELKEKDPVAAVKLWLDHCADFTDANYAHVSEWVADTAAKNADVGNILETQAQKDAKFVPVWQKSKRIRAGIEDGLSSIVDLTVRPKKQPQKGKDVEVGGQKDELFRAFDKQESQVSSNGCGNNAQPVPFLYFAAIRRRGDLARAA